MGAGLVLAGAAHLTTLRREFQAQVPGWMPGDPDAVVVWSGYAEIALGAAVLLAVKVAVGAVAYIALLVLLAPQTLRLLLRGAT